MALADVTREAVRAALDEFDQRGREVFLARYGFGKARSYFAVRDGKRYDSKAVVGRADGYARPDLGPLFPKEFRGGEATVASLLHNVGFKVVNTAGEPFEGKTSQRNPPWTRDELILAQKICACSNAVAHPQAYEGGKNGYVQRKYSAGNRGFHD